MLAGLFIDLSGVIYEGSRVIPGAIDAIARARQSGLTLRFLTNTSRRSRQQLLDDLHRLGFDINDTELFTAPDAAKAWIKQHRRRPFCLIHQDLQCDFAELEQFDANLVLIGDAAEDFNYANLNRAFQLCQAGAPLLAMGYNRYFKLHNQLHLDAGPFIKAIEFAASVDAVIVGKPASAFFQHALLDAGLSADQVLMIGDDVYGDVQGAIKAGLHACLVRTGKYQPDDENLVADAFSTVDSIVEAVELVINT